MKALLPFFLALLFAGSASAQDPDEPVLDQYVFGVGQNSDSCLFSIFICAPRSAQLEL